MLTRTLRYQRISQSPLETRGVVATKQGEDELLVYISCQSPHPVSRYLSVALGHPQLSIWVIAKDVGGAFGLSRCHGRSRTRRAYEQALRIRRPDLVDRAGLRISSQLQKLESSIFND